MLQKVTCKHCQVCAARMYGGSVGLHVREYRPGINDVTSNVFWPAYVLLSLWVVAEHGLSQEQYLSSAL